MADPGTERSPDSLVAQTHSERRDDRTEFPDDVRTHPEIPRVCGVAGARRQDDHVGIEATDLAQRNRIVAMHDRSRAEFSEPLVQVVYERIVVVDDQDVHRNPPTNMRSRTTIAATFSTTGTARGTMQGSWRPVTTMSAGVIVSRSTDRCGVAIDAVGLTATRKVTGIPFVIPPRIPPAWFVSVTTRPASIAKGSLCSLPRMAAARNPAPKSTPFTAGIENRRCASVDSTESKNGSPMPAGRPVTIPSMTPPTLFRSLRAASISAIMRSAASRSAHRTGVRSTCASIWLGVTGCATTRPIWAACAKNRTPFGSRTCRAMAPETTRGAVMRPDSWPPPRRSVLPPYFMRAVKSPWPGLGTRALFA